MGRLDTRYNVKLPVNLTLTDQIEEWRLKTTTSNIGLGGAFFKVDLSPSDGMMVHTETSIPGHGDLLFSGKIVRKDNSGFAIQFERLSGETRSLLQKYLREKGLSREHCPVCHNYLGENNRQCPFCKYPVNQNAFGLPALYQEEEAVEPHELIEMATDRFMLDMTEIEKRFTLREFDEEIYLERAQEIIRQFTTECQRFEKAVQDRDIIKAAQKRFREKSNDLIVQSHFMNHARIWPQGYVGDHRIIEDIYRSTPQSEGMGILLDRVFLATELGKAVPARKDLMREIVEREISGNSSLNILNIGCGSCRELVELSSTIKESKAKITCLDFDSAALDFSAERFAMTGIDNHIALRKYNALKMINQERNAREFGPQHLIYSIGLLDYLTDDVLIRFIRAIYELLTPNGKFIAVFKDSDRYDFYKYHWVVDWDAFYQRKASESLALLKKAGIPEKDISMERDRTGVIIFYTLEKNE